MLARFTTYSVPGNHNKPSQLLLRVTYGCRMSFPPHPCLFNVIPWIRSLIVNMMVDQLVKIPALYGIANFFRVHKGPWNWNTFVCTTLRSILLLSAHLCLGATSYLFPSYFPLQLVSTSSYQQKNTANKIDLYINFSNLLSLKDPESLISSWHVSSGSLNICSCLKNCVLMYSSSVALYRKTTDFKCSLISVYLWFTL